MKKRRFNSSNGRARHLRGSDGFSQGRSQTFSFWGATGGASFAARGAVDGLCRTFRKRPTERDLILGGPGKILGGSGPPWHPLAPPLVSAKIPQPIMLES